MDGFKSYDFEADERWKSYLRSIELPAGDSQAAMTRVKARWYKKNIDPDFDPATVSSAPKPPPASTPQPSASVPPPPRQQPTYAAPPQPPSYGSTAYAAPVHGGPSGLRRLFLMQLALLVLGLAAQVPFGPWGRRAYVFFMRLAMITFGYKIYLQHGLPSLRPLSAAKAWLQRAMPTPDFLTLITLLSFSAQPPMSLVAVPPLVLSAYHAAAYASRQYSGHPLWARFGSRVHAVMLRRQPDAVLLNAFAEVATLGVLLLQLLTPARSPLTLLFYVQILKLKLHLPDSAPQHRTVWQKLDELTARRRNIPILEKGVQLAARWFTALPAQPQ